MPTFFDDREERLVLTLSDVGEGAERVNIQMNCISLSFFDNQVEIFGQPHNLNLRARDSREDPGGASDPSGMETRKRLILQGELTWQ
jgi:hypothetical protein